VYRALQAEILPEKQVLQSRNAVKPAMRRSAGVFAVLAKNRGRKWLFANEIWRYSFLFYSIKPLHALYLLACRSLP
jgi:hypothetical protein